MRILIVEDEHKIANSLKKGFEQERLTVDVAYDGLHGHDLAVTEEYDVIVLDRLLPGMDGVEIVKKIREKKIHTPILLLTAKGQIEERVGGLNEGADDYMAKPFAFSELLARIKALSRRPRKNIESIIKVADITLNTDTYEVKRDDKHLSLTHKEFSLLQYLMRHIGQTVDKDRILNHVWSYDADVLPNSVEVYIRHLRKKLGEPDIIKTVRGFGYKIEN